MTRRYFIILFFTLTLSLFAQYRITYSLRYYQPGDNEWTEIQKGTVSEGDQIVFPPYTLTGDAQNYQNLYEVVKGTSFKLENGSLNEDVSLAICVMGFDRNAETYYFNHEVFFFIGIQVLGANSGFHDFDDVYALNSGHYAYVQIPNDQDLQNELNHLRIDIDDVDFGYYQNNEFNQNGIHYENRSSYLEVQLSHFSKFGGGRRSIMPVELTSFSANVMGKNVRLEWTTATEKNNYGFEIERRNLENPWLKIGFVPGAGNSNSPKTYFFHDKNLFPGEFFYRLKQIDLNGQFEYSPSIKVNLSSADEFELYQNYPNPFNPSTNISFSVPTESEVTIKIFDALGKELMTFVKGKFAAGTYTKRLDAKNLPSGIYFYTLETESPSGTKLIGTKKFILIK